MNQGVRQPVHLHTFNAQLPVFDETLAQPDFCSCKLLWCRDERVLLPCFNAQPDIFAVMTCCVVALSLFFSDCLTWSADSLYSVDVLQRHIVYSARCLETTHTKKGVDGKICILCQQTLLKLWFGNMEMTSNCDFTNSAHQIQMTTIWPWTKTPPMKIFCVRHWSSAHITQHIAVTFFLCNEVRKIKPSCNPKNEHLGELIRTALTTHCRDFRGLQNQTKT